jgi:uncharacterized membrane protein YedE/YeeE
MAVMMAAFLIAAVMGAAIARSNYCTLGAVSDWINMGDLGRLRAWLVAMATAVTGVGVLSLAGLVDVTESRIPYAGRSFAWSRYLIGGVLFGIGITLSSGCSSKNLVRAGAGSGKAAVVLTAGAAAAYVMTKTRFYGWTFGPALSPLHVALPDLGLLDQRISSIAAALFGFDVSFCSAVVGVVSGLALFVFTFTSRTFRANKPLWITGLIIGTAVTAGWAITAGPLGRQWIEDAAFVHVMPTAVGVQSFTFVGPLADAAALLVGPNRSTFVTFGLCATSGMFAGSLAFAVACGRWRWEWFVSGRDFTRNVIGGLLLGTGGVLALGCTIGQGVTGISTLALGSFIATGATVLGSALTMRFELYRMVYEKDAGIFPALLSALADLRLLPPRCRRLDRV